MLEEAAKAFLREGPEHIPDKHPLSFEHTSVELFLPMTRNARGSACPKVSQVYVISACNTIDWAAIARKCRLAWFTPFFLLFRSFAPHFEHKNQVRTNFSVGFFCLYQYTSFVAQLHLFFLTNTHTLSHHDGNRVTYRIMCDILFTCSIWWCRSTGTGSMFLPLWWTSIMIIILCKFIFQFACLKIRM